MKQFSSDIIIQCSKQSIKWRFFFRYLLGANQALSADNQQGNQQESDEFYALQWFQEQILQKANTYKKWIMSTINEFAMHYESLLLSSLFQF